MAAPTEIMEHHPFPLGSPPDVYRLHLNAEQLRHLRGQYGEDPDEWNRQVSRMLGRPVRIIATRPLATST